MMQPASSIFSGALQFLEATLDLVFVDNLDDVKKNSFAVFQ
jgi:hypothetical protein